MHKTLYNIRIIQAKRLRNSRNGNPRFELLLSDDTLEPGFRLWTVNTAADTSCGYAVDNHTGRGRVNITISGRGTVIGIDKV